MRRPKFSIATILLVIALAGVSLSTLVNSWQLAEVERQRDEVIE